MGTAFGGVLFLLFVSDVIIAMPTREFKRLLISKRGSKPSSCTPEYAAMPASTMCDYNDKPDAKNRGVNSATKQIILDEHNKWRRNVDPPQSNMQEMVWDKELAKFAQKWANTCPNGHDTNDQRAVPGYGIFIGQNYASGGLFDSWPPAIKAWYDEVSMFRYGQDPDVYLGPGGWAKVGHFTQVVHDISNRVGCGFAVCDRGTNPKYVCNYAFGNSPDSLKKPYKSGRPCGECANNCHNNLCDCNGKLCKNNGKLNVGNCQCECVKPYSGEYCENAFCPDPDPDYCGKPQPYGFPKGLCKKYSNVPEECPIMCGICTLG